MKHEFSEVSDVVGKQFGNWTVLKFDSLNNQKRRVYLCRCACGQEKLMRIDVVVGKQILSCGCLSHQKGNKSPKWNGRGELSGAKWAIIKHSAKIRNIPFNITIDQAWEGFTKQNGKCALSGVSLTFPKFRNDFSATASLDRIDSSKGYEPANIQWIDKDINLMKNDFDQSKFIELCSLVHKNSIGWPQGRC